MKNVLKKAFALTLALSLSVSLLSIGALASEFNGWKEEQAAIAVMRGLMGNDSTMLGKYAVTLRNKQFMLNSADTGAEDIAYTYNTQVDSGETETVNSGEKDENGQPIMVEQPVMKTVSVSVTVGEVAESVNDAIESEGISINGAVWRIYHSGTKNNFFFGYTTDAEYDDTRYTGVADILLYEGRENKYLSGSAYLDLDGVLVVRGSGTDDVVYGSEEDQEFAAVAADAVLDPVLKLYSGSAVDDAAEITYATDGSKVLTLPVADGGTEYTVTGYGSGNNHIVITDDVTLHLTHVTIEDLASGLSAIDIAPGCTATIIIDGEVFLTGGKDGAGIAVPADMENNKIAAVEISGAGSLTAIGNDGTDSASGGAGIGGTAKAGDSGSIHIAGLNSLCALGYGEQACGIGSAANGSSTDITIESTNLTLVRGGYANSTIQTKYGNNDHEGGAAIGGGAKGGVCGDILISNSTILNALGGSKCAAIGGCCWADCGTITLDNSEVTAVGGATGPAIGVSRTTMDYGSTSGTDANAEIIIRGGSVVTATGGDYGAGIGTGYNSSSVGNGSDTVLPALTTVTISNSTVTANGGAGGAAIGGGYKGCNVKIDILGASEVTAVGGVLNTQFDVGKKAAHQSDASAIGTGANGSGQFNGSTVSIDAAADVTAFARGDKFAIDTGKGTAEGNVTTTAKILQGTFVHTEAYEGKNLSILNFDATASEAIPSFQMPAEYRSFAKTVPTAGNYLVYSNTDSKYCTYNTENAEEFTENKENGTPTLQYAVSGTALSDNYYLYLSDEQPTLPTPAPTPDPGPTDIPNGDTPLADLPENDTPLTDAPADADTTDISDEAAPLSAAPSKTGDSHVAIISGACALASLAGLAYVTLSGKKKETKI